MLTDKRVRAILAGGPSSMTGVEEFKELCKTALLAAEASPPDEELRAVAKFGPLSTEERRFIQHARNAETLGVDYGWMILFLDWEWKSKKPSTYRTPL